MLRTRLLTALVGIPLALGIVFAPGGWLMAFALSGLALLGALEYRRAYQHADWIPQPRPNMILLLAGACLPVAFWLFPQASLLTVLLPALAGAAMYELSRAWQGRNLGIAPNIGYGILGMLYIGWLFSFGVLLRADDAPATLGGWQVERGALWVLWLLAMLWLGDSALKRAVGVKDFGGILPGHGGVLDRFDSFLFSVPWVWWVVQMAGSVA